MRKKEPQIVDLHYQESEQHWAPLSRLAVHCIPLGLLVIQRQLELGYKLDTSTAWYAASLISAPLLVMHGAKALLSSPTITLAGLYLVNLWNAALALSAASSAAKLTAKINKWKREVADKDAQRIQLEAKRDTLEEELAEIYKNSEKIIQEHEDELRSKLGASIDKISLDERAEFEEKIAEVDTKRKKLVQDRERHEESRVEFERDLAERDKELAEQEKALRRGVYGFILQHPSAYRNVTYLTFLLLVANVFYVVGAQIFKPDVPILAKIFALAFAVTSIYSCSVASKCRFALSRALGNG